MQTIPSRSELAPMVKGVFQAAPGHKLVAIDYATLELRIMAMLAGEETMIRAFREGRDLHTETAREISELLWGSSFDDCGLGYTFDDLRREGDVDGERWDALKKAQKARRTVAKAVNFGVAYGQGPATMAEQWGIPEADAEKAQNAIMGQRRKLRAWIQEQQKLARQRGYTETWWAGKPARRRPLPEIASDSRELASHAERASYNTPVQGTGSEFCLASLCEISRWIEEDGIDAKLVLTVHDSIIAEVEDADVEEYIYQATRIMTSWPSEGVPITVDVEVGQSYGAMSAYEAA